MKWALVRGNSTGTDSKGIHMPRGLGFDLLSDFVKLNKGEMRIYSNTVVASIKGGNDYHIEKSKYELSGTMVSIKIDCNGRFYCFESEKANAAHQYF